MRNERYVNVVIPALNEEQAIASVLKEIPAWVDRVIVVDNGSTDRTAEVAAAHGAQVVSEPRRGYGSACLAGIAVVDRADVVVFLDADRSDDPALMDTLVDPIVHGQADLVIGSRVLGNAAPGSLTLPQRFGNALACRLLRLGFGARHTDLGPFRAASLPALKRMGMTDRDYGWTVQMQARAARLRLRVIEAPVSYRKRIGQSKISGTIRGVVGAGTKILATLAVERVRHSFAAPLDSARQRLLVFARFPESGKTKTRLIPALGAEGAALLHAQMIRRTMHVASGLAAVGVELHHHGGLPRNWRTLLRTKTALRPQVEGDLGTRLRIAIENSFARGDEAVVVIGTDCPFVDRRTILDAFDRLRRCDMVIGPATDGGYYLLGLRRPARQVFEGIDWGTANVLAQTLAQAASAGLSISQLNPLADIDTPVDLGLFAPSSSDRGRPPRYSVIIASHNEEQHIAAAIASAREREDVQIIVVDSASTDRTRDIAAAMGAQVIQSPANRATQTNLGAEAATGNILVFLHGDTSLPPGWSAIARAALRRPGVVAGAFHLGIDGSAWRFRAIESMTNLRTCLTGRPSGDQAVFIRRTDFLNTGGFRDTPAMKDDEWIRRIRRHGKIVIAGARVATSAGRFRLRGSTHS